MSYPPVQGDTGLEPNPLTGYVYEPWHWRYVGTAVATDYSKCTGSDTILMNYLRHPQCEPRVPLRKARGVSS